MIHLLTGIQGSGKTTTMVAMAKLDHDQYGTKVFSNTPLGFDYTPIDLAKFLESFEGHELENCWVLLDEGYQWFDSRSSQTKINKLFSYFLVQTRKSGSDVVICTHFTSNLEIRARRITDMIGACSSYKLPCPRCKCRSCGGTGKVKGLKCPECNGKGGTGAGTAGEPLGCTGCFGYGFLGRIVVKWTDRRYGGLKRQPWSYWGNTFWPLFDTTRKIPVLQSQIKGIDTREVGVEYA